MAAAHLGQSYSSGSLVCQQADKRQSPLHLPVALAERGVRETLLAFAELLGNRCFSTAGVIRQVLHPVLTSRKVMLSKPWELLFSVGVLLASLRCFSQYQPPAATSATTTRARSTLSATSATKLPEGFSAGGGNAVISTHCPENCLQPQPLTLGSSGLTFHSQNCAHTPTHPPLFPAPFAGPSGLEWQPPLVLYMMSSSATVPSIGHLRVVISKLICGGRWGLGG